MIRALEHAYYVARDGAAVRALIADGTPAAGPAETIQAGIDTIPPGTTYCLAESQVSPTLYAVSVTEHRPGGDTVDYEQTFQVRKAPDGTWAVVKISNTGGAGHEAGSSRAAAAAVASAAVAATLPATTATAAVASGGCDGFMAVLVPGTGRPPSMRTRLRPGCSGRSVPRWKTPMVPRSRWCIRRILRPRSTGCCTHSPLTRASSM
ncbi:hypothetical protein [Tomitella cavernea]|uniref:DUF8176 domain-containing protein n=1 Tax=Tomitella cavernea TaxID=1387982 RepID=A0ABP9D362_9ACTN